MQTSIELDSINCPLQLSYISKINNWTMFKTVLFLFWIFTMVLSYLAIKAQNANIHQLNFLNCPTRFVTDPFFLSNFMSCKFRLLPLFWVQRIHALNRAVSIQIILAERIFCISCFCIISSLKMFVSIFYFENYTTELTSMIFIAFMTKSLLFFKMYYLLTKNFNVKMIFKIGQTVPVISSKKKNEKIHSGT